jgi:hypothetical protein
VVQRWQCPARRHGSAPGVLLLRAALWLYLLLVLHEAAAAQAAVLLCCSPLPAARSEAACS